MTDDEGTPPGKSSGYTWEGGVDWVTFIERDPERARELVTVAKELHAEHGDRCARRKHFELGGYIGWAQGSIRIGHRGASSLLQLSAEVAAKSFRRLAAFSGQPTRLDLQVTLSLSDRQPLFARRFMRPATSQTSSTRSSPLPCGSWKHSNGACLITVGDRTSSRYFRLYDKGTEQGTHQPGEIWRVELEAKKAEARRLWRALLGASDTEDFCWDIVSERWRSSGYSWPLRGPSKIRKTPRVPSPALPESERLERWMQTSVAPAAQRLLRVMGPDEIVRLLKLPPTTPPHDAAH